MAVVGLGDEERPATAHDRQRLAQDELDEARVVLAPRDLARALGRHDVRELELAPLDLRDRLLRHAQDVAVGERHPLAAERRREERGEIVPRPQLADALDADDAELAHRPMAAAASALLDA